MILVMVNHLFKGGDVTWGSLSLLYSHFAFLRTGVCHEQIFLFFRNTVQNAYTHTRMSTHPYEHTHVHPTFMSTSERLNKHTHTLPL
jgi:hypothetical protein